jgi:hypothetical protein
MPDLRPTPRRTLRPLAMAVAIILFVAVGVFGAGWRPHGESVHAADAAQGDAATAALQAAPPAASAPRAASASAIELARAPGRLTAAQWRTISERIEPGPGHDLELARIASLMAFQDDVARLRELRDDPAAAEERRRLAREIDAGIELHLARREATGPEAVLLKTAVLAEIEPDAAARAAQLEDFRREIQAENPPASDPRVAAYQRQEAAIVAEWQSGPASQRDPAVLARRLQQLQVAVFDEGGR